MRPKKEQLEAIRANGDWARVVRDLSAAYLLVNMAMGRYLEATDRLREHGLNLGRTKQLDNRLEKAFDEYIQDFAKMVDSCGQQMHFAHDFDELTPLVTPLVLKVLGYKEEDLR